MTQNDLKRKIVLDNLFKELTFSTRFLSFALLSVCPHKMTFWLSLVVLLLLHRKHLIEA